MSLDVRDVEKLENTSFATALAGTDVGAATTLDTSCALEGSTPDIVATVTTLFTHNSVVDCATEAVSEIIFAGGTDFGDCITATNVETVCDLAEPLETVDAADAAGLAAFAGADATGLLDVVRGRA